jgi:hypothetical protein
VKPEKEDTTMARIKIKDLPRDKKITKEEMKKVMGGFNPQPEPPGIFLGLGGDPTINLWKLNQGSLSFGVRY